MTNRSAQRRANELRQRGTAGAPKAKGDVTTHVRGIVQRSLSKLVVVALVGLLFVAGRWLVRSRRGEGPPAEGPPAEGLPAGMASSVSGTVGHLRAIVLGASGAVGSMLVPALLKDSNYDRVTIFTRKQTAHTFTGRHESLVPVLTWSPCSHCTHTVCSRARAFSAFSLCRPPMLLYAVLLLSLAVPWRTLRSHGLVPRATLWHRCFDSANNACNILRYLYGRTHT